jgi:hypothetical protein
MASIAYWRLGCTSDRKRSWLATGLDFAAEPTTGNWQGSHGDGLMAALLGVDQWEGR